MENPLPSNGVGSVMGGGLYVSVVNDGQHIMDKFRCLMGNVIMLQVTLELLG